MEELAHLKATVQMQNDEINILVGRVTALVNVVETLLAVSPLAHVNANDRPLAQWRRIARNGQ